MQVSIGPWHHHSGDWYSTDAEGEKVLGSPAIPKYPGNCDVAGQSRAELFTLLLRQDWLRIVRECSGSNIGQTGVEGVVWQKVRLNTEKERSCKDNKVRKDSHKGMS